MYQLYCVDNIIIFQVQRKVALEYDEVKTLKNTLQTLRIDTSVDVPIGARRPLLRDEPVRDIGEILSSDPFVPSAVNDPDVWPSPIPADHSYGARYVQCGAVPILLVTKINFSVYLL